jgi:succinate dehydrogenase cytochrome b subunit
VRLSDRAYLLLKRVQVLTGVVPVGLFLISHLAVNARAIQGADAFHRTTTAIARLPLLPWLELLGIGLPILAHVALGVLLGVTAQGAGDRRGYGSWPRLLGQRVTGFLLVVYVAFHVWGIRLSPSRTEAAELFPLTRGVLEHPGVLALHVAGVLAAAWHFGNGLPALVGPWGWDLGPRVARVAARTGMAVFVVLSLVGLNALLAFVTPAFRWLEPR